MKKQGTLPRFICISLLCGSLVSGTGCATQGQTGALAGAGTGALIGGRANMHGSWAATALIGAGIGAGVGYLIGNEKDKKEAERRQAVTEGETRPLAGTSWQAIRIVPTPEKEYRSIVTSFRPDGTVVTTKTNMDGRAERTVERYRIIGSTLIINKPGYVANIKFKLGEDRLILDYGNGSVEFQRIS